jgi:hypothetical protein
MRHIHIGPPALPPKQTKKITISETDPYLPPTVIVYIVQRQRKYYKLLLITCVVVIITAAACHQYLQYLNFKVAKSKLKSFGFVFIAYRAETLELPHDLRDMGYPVTEMFKIDLPTRGGPLESKSIHIGNYFYIDWSKCGTLNPPNDYPVLYSENISTPFYSGILIVYANGNVFWDRSGRCMKTFILTHPELNPSVPSL